MDALNVLTNLSRRPLQALDVFWPNLDPAMLNVRPDNHPNSIAWLMWHTARATDAQLAPLAGAEQVWTDQAFGASFGFTNHNLGIADMGTGQSADEARAIFVPETQAGKELLHDYLHTVYQRATAWIGTLAPEDLDEIVDSSYDPPVTLGVRIVSVFDDAAQHMGQAAYIAGTGQSAPPSSTAP